MSNAMSSQVLENMVLEIEVGNINKGLGTLELSLTAAPLATNANFDFRVRSSDTAPTYLVYSKDPW
jgi:hypothetical protein